MLMRFVPLIWLAWVPLVVILFPVMPIRRSIIAAFVVGTLFLPESPHAPGLAAIVRPLSLPGLHFIKENVICYAALLGVLLYDSDRMGKFRPGWIDLPMLAWCLCPFFTVLANDPPPDGSSMLRDAFAQTLAQTFLWLPPYIIGKVYFTDPDNARELALGIILGAIAYVPLCLIENRLSPQLHFWVYGYNQHNFSQTIRGGGYRPTVFMKHGLQVALWMVMASLLAFWLWWTKEPNRRNQVAKLSDTFFNYVLIPLIPTTLILHSTGALFLGMAGGVVLTLTKWLKSRYILASLFLVPPLYVIARSSGEWTGDNLVAFVRKYVNEERANSLEFRLMNENELVKRALVHPLLGWGGWGRNRVLNSDDKDSVTDGMWIIVLGNRGILGLSFLGISLLLPALRFIYLMPRKLWSRQVLAPFSGGALLIVLMCIDWLLNAHYNSVYILFVGALAGIDTNILVPLPLQNPSRALPSRNHGRTKEFQSISVKGKVPPWNPTK